MIHRLTVLLTLALLLTGGLPAQAQMQIEGLGAADLALLGDAGMDEDTLHFDLVLSAAVTGDPTLAMGIDLSGTGAFGMDDVGLPLMTMDLEGTTTAPDQGEVAGFVQLRLVDNILYLLAEGQDAWQVMPLDEGLADAGLPADTSEIAGAQAVDFLGWLEFLGLEAFSSGARSDADGMATIRIDVDLGAWLASPTFSELMTVAGDVTADETLAAMGPMLGMLLQDLLLSIESLVELDSGLTRQTSLDLGMAINAAALGGSAQSETTEITVTLAFDDMRYGGALEVSVPEGAVPADA
ncbi:MAG: hypothetical protein OXB89_06665 [Anaerolineaceae bacterium]|nr:hypothetical protein [Anaerolineaceae bacterium]